MGKDQKELNQMLEIISECGWVISVFSYILFRISEACYSRHILLLFIRKKKLYLLETSFYSIYLVFLGNFHNV